jgi:hypothetical protein
MYSEKVEPLQELELREAALAGKASERDDPQLTGIGPRGLEPRTSMVPPPHDRKNWLMQIGQRLQAEYDAALAAPLPERLTELLKQLEKPAKAADQNVTRSARLRA